MYHVHLNLENHNGLHPLEAGRRTRDFTVPTLAAAVALCNVARLSAGQVMERGPRSLAPGDCFEIGLPNRPVRCSITRLKKRNR